MSPQTARSSRPRTGRIRGQVEDGALIWPRAIAPVYDVQWPKGVPKMAPITAKNAFNLCTRLVGVACIGLAVLSSAPAAKNASRQDWRESFPVKKTDLTHTGRNTYFILEPGFRLQLKHGNDALTITVLNETKLVDGVTTRIVEEREIKDGQLVEVSRNYFAIDRTTRDVYYFGEDVDMYENGKVIGHEGAWLSGVNGARFGLMIPGKPAGGDRYYQENAPGIARTAPRSSVPQRISRPLRVISRTACIPGSRARLSKALRISGTRPTLG